MRWSTFGLSVLTLLSGCSEAKSWSFEDASLTVSRKGEGVGGGQKEK